MKRILALIVVLSILTPATNAHAILGLSKCEKTKSQVNIIEKRIFNYSRIIDRYASPIGTPGTAIKISAIPSSILNASSRMDTDLNEIWKLGTNNPKCFTNTQKMAIKTTDNWKRIHYFSLSKLGVWAFIEKISVYESIYSK